MHCGRPMLPVNAANNVDPIWLCDGCGLELPRLGICDFCSDPNPVINEVADDFDVNPGPVGRSMGAWGACQGCHELIAAEKWLELEERGIDAMRRKFPRSSRNTVRLAVQAIQRQFRIHRRELSRG